MAWGIRKRVRVGPANLNLSKHGIGTSLGVRGVRMGLDSRGRRYSQFSIPGTGVYKRSYGRRGTGFELAGLVFGAIFFVKTILLMLSLIWSLMRGALALIWLLARGTWRMARTKPRLSAVLALVALVVLLFGVLVSPNK
jgi:hypothetical protein